MVESWAESELKYADLGDKRLNKRLVKMVEDFANQPNASVPQACGDWAGTQGAYDFWGNKRVKASDIRDAHACSTRERIKKHSLILAIQDTTELNLTHHRATQGLGYLDSASSRGLKVHTTLCVSSTGIPLGVLNQEVWFRDLKELGKKHLRHQKLTQDKESQKWITALRSTNTYTEIEPSITVVTVADQEADIYDLFNTPRPLNSELLIRARHNRVVSGENGENEEERKLQDTIRSSAPLGQKVLELKANPKREAREATLTIRATSVLLTPPKKRLKKDKNLKPIKMQLILAEEENPPPDVDPVSWLLLTTLPITGLPSVFLLLVWYSYRWLIERYHYILKSGCGLEKLQLKTAERISKALATYNIVAWRLLWLTYVSRIHPEEPVDLVLEPHQWQALYCYIHVVAAPPLQMPTVNQCVRWIAQLGGFLGRKGDGEPGLKTIWRGLRRLDDIAQTWLILHSGSSPPLEE
jgi:hypothetical protein